MAAPLAVIANARRPRPTAAVAGRPLLRARGYTAPIVLLLLPANTDRRPDANLPSVIRAPQMGPLLPLASRPDVRLFRGHGRNRRSRQDATPGPTVDLSYRAIFLSVWRRPRRRHMDNLTLTGGGLGRLAANQPARLPSRHGRRRPASRQPCLSSRTKTPCRVRTQEGSTYLLPYDGACYPTSPGPLRRPRNEDLAVPSRPMRRLAAARGVHRTASEPSATTS